MIARAVLQRFRLPLCRPLATARGTVVAREGVLLELVGRSGARGFAEAMPLAGWRGETLDEAECDAFFFRVGRAISPFRGRR